MVVLKLQSFALLSPSILLLALASSALAQSNATMNQLVAKARQESTLNAMLNSNAPKSALKIADAFKKRFGLDKLEVKLDASGRETEKFQKALVETKTGAPPTFDTMQGEEVNVLRMVESGGAESVENWQSVLREINPLVGTGTVPPTKVSPHPFSGVGFIYANRVTVLIYNREMLKSHELPKTHADLADPKYKGKIAVSQFISEWQYGALVYDKQRWLNIVNSIGRNTAAVLFPAAITDRMALGEFALSPNNIHYQFITMAKDPNAPIGVHFLSDFTPLRELTYVVRKGARSPGAATLFALWMTTPEAHIIRSAEDFSGNIRYGSTDLDKAQRQLLKGANLVSWVDTAETLKLLDWYTTEEGLEYSKRLADAIKQRK
jgi:ABC-type Fe3+ transport system substrate-binding protein